MASPGADLQGLLIDAADVRGVALCELRKLRQHLTAIATACQGLELTTLLLAAQNQIAEAEECIAGQTDVLIQDIQQLAHNVVSEVRHA